SVAVPKKFPEGWSGVITQDIELARQKSGHCTLVRLWGQGIGRFVCANRLRLLLGCLVPGRLGPERGGAAQCAPGNDLRPPAFPSRGGRRPFGEVLRRDQRPWCDRIRV